MTTPYPSVAGEPEVDLLSAELVSARQDLDNAAEHYVAMTKRLAELTHQRDQALTSAESAWNDREDLIKERDDALAAMSEADKRAALLAGTNAELLEQVGKQGLRLAELEKHHATCTTNHEGEPSK